VLVPLDACIRTGLVGPWLMLIPALGDYLPTHVIFCSPFCAKAKRALGSVLDSSKIMVIEVSAPAWLRTHACSKLQAPKSALYRCLRVAAAVMRCWKCKLRAADLVHLQYCSAPDPHVSALHIPHGVAQKPLLHVATQLDQRDDGNAIQDELASLTGGRSVPRVFINQKVIFFLMSPSLKVRMRLNLQLHSAH